MFFGLQYIIKRWLVGPVITKEKIAEAKEITQKHFAGQNFFNEEGFNYIVEVSSKMFAFISLKFETIFKFQFNSISIYFFRNMVAVCLSE